MGFWTDPKLYEITLLHFHEGVFPPQGAIVELTRRFRSGHLFIDIAGYVFVLVGFTYFGNNRQDFPCACFGKAEGLNPT